MREDANSHTVLFEVVSARFLISLTEGPMIAFSLFPISGDIFPFLSLNQYSCFNSFFFDFEISCSDHLTFVSLYHGLLDNSASTDLD